MSTVTDQGVFIPILKESVDLVKPTQAVDQIVPTEAISPVLEKVEEITTPIEKQISFEKAQEAAPVSGEASDYLSYSSGEELTVKQRTHKQEGQRNPNKFEPANNGSFYSVKNRNQRIIKGSQES